MPRSIPTYAPPAEIARSQPEPDPVAARADGGRPRVPPQAPAWAEWAKVVLDVVLGAVLLVVFAPLILLAAAAVRLSSPGPAFYFQTRLGRGGRPFRIAKLRTMYCDSEAKSGPQWSRPGDPRITRLGKVLRATHLDELPQLINVLRLEMSLVGPRPERPEIIPTLEKAIPNYRDRLRVRPGVTGLAQLRLPADTCIPGVRRKLAYDLHYVRTFGLWLDLRLMACTAVKMACLPLPRVLRLCRVPGPAAVGLADLADDTREQEPLPPLPPKG